MGCLVVGLAGFGQGDGLPNATVALFAHDAAQRLFDLDGKVSEIQLVTDGPTADVRDQLAERLGDRVEITTAKATAAASADAAKDQLGYIKTMLLVLAATALLVGAFLIANTFSILVAQRTRELAMLRAVGATGRQVTVSVLSEAAAVGLLASAAGSGLGIVAAAALRRLVSASGVDLPAGALVVAPLRLGHWLDGNASKALTAVDPATLPAVAKVDMLAGDLAALRDGGIILAEKDAANHGVALGDQLTMTLPRSGDQRLRVVGIVDDDAASALSTGYLISLETYARHFGEDVDASVLVRFAPGVAAERGMAKLRQAIAEFPTAAVRDQAEARASRTSTVDSVLALVTVLLLLAVLIALLGIANTLGLSIIERTREVGLLRSVGMARRQVAWMVRLEAVLVATVGAVAGVALGLLFGWAAVAALTAQATVRFTVPPTQLLAFLVVAAIGGGLAGMLPARRASRLDVLAAISSE